MFWVGSRPRNTTGEDWVLDLAEIKPTATRYKYLPVSEDTFLR